MVLITVSPERTGRIVCIPKPSRSRAVTLSFARTTKPAVTYSVEEKLYTNSINHKDTNCSFSSAICGLFLVVILLSLVCLVAVVSYVRRRRLQSKEYNKTKKNDKETAGFQTLVTLKGVSSYSEEESQYKSNEQDQIAGDNGKSILPSSGISVSYGSHSYQKSDIHHTPISTCDTISDTFMYDSVRETTLNEVPSAEEMTEEESFHDTDMCEETPICLLKSLLPDETENDFNG